VYYFRSTAGDAISTTNNALGTVIMAFDYNPVNANFTNKIQMENTMWSMSGKPSVDMCVPVECAKNENPIQTLYVRTGSLPANTDERLYDLGNFQIATQGMQAGSIDVGELWVSYDIVFKKPIIQPSSGGSGSDVLSAHYTSATSVSTSHYFGTTRTRQFDNFLSGESNYIQFTGTAISFPLGITGAFQVSVVYTGSATLAVVSPGIVLSGSGNALYIGQGNTTTSDGYASDTAPGTIGGSSPTVTSMMSTIYLYILDPTTECVLTYSGATLPTGSTVNVVITQLNGNLVT